MSKQRTLAKTMKKLWPLKGRQTAVAVTALTIVIGFIIYNALAYVNYRNNWKVSGWGGWSARIAACESGWPTRPNWLTIESGTGPSGKYQIANSTWAAFGGLKYATRAKYASESQQDAIAYNIFKANGTRDWRWSQSCWGSSGGSILSRSSKFPYKNYIPSCAASDTKCSGNETPASGGGGSSSGSCSTSGGDTSGSHPTISRSNPVSSTCVKHAQYILTHVAKWRNDSSVDPKGVDGAFGSNTEKAVKAYKVSKGLSNTGTIDSKTWSALHGSCAYMRKYPKTGAGCGVSVPSGGSTGSSSGGTSSSGCPSGGDSSGSHSTVKYGSNSTCVKHLQYILTQTHKWRVRMYGSANVDPKGVDGSFGNNTKTAVVNYQKGKGITADGIVGPTTWGKLHGSCATINKYNFGGSKTYGIKC